MKRERTSVNGVIKFWRLLKWEYCRRCKKEFVRESGWEINKSRGANLIVCKGCCPTLGDADLYFTAVQSSWKNNWKRKKK